ncbi:MAG TPA: lysylphosphatidylglycerol synthase domain-containing protein [Acetobacteraceae bacterium]|nr:lysylphosphatidylglycerol synthase domain-containing protein [Acetobacteraceae bacterium]
MRKVAILLALLGVGLAVGLVVWLGAGKIVRSVAAVGWGGFAILVGWQFLMFVVLAFAWRRLCPGARMRTLIWGRLVREGGANILPFSEVGALAFGARAITLGGVKWERAVASSIADTAAEFIGEIPFILFGFAMLMARAPGSSLVLPLALGLALLAALVAALVWAEKHSARLFHALGRRIAARWARRAARQADVIQHDFEHLFSQPRRIGSAACIHLAGWIGGGVTVWMAYRMLGGQIDVVRAMAIEGLLSGALAVAFLVPGGLGVQEASYVLIGQAFGMPAHLSIGLSFLRRARDIIIGAPALGAWQVMEVRQLRRGGARAESAAGE